MSWPWKSSSDWLNYTGFPGDVCLLAFLETKMLWHQTMEEESRHVSDCDDEHFFRINYMLDFQKYVTYLKFAAYNV